MVYFSNISNCSPHASSQGALQTKWERYECNESFYEDSWHYPEGYAICNSLIEIYQKICCSYSSHHIYLLNSIIGVYLVHSKKKEIGWFQYNNVLKLPYYFFFLWLYIYTFFEMTNVIVCCCVISSDK